MRNPNQRVPPPCWDADETRALVVAYRDRWFSVNRGSLRSPDWAAIADSVPPKTPLQCQHKVEKLRRRYREEKRRLLRNPNRSSSSWHLFPLLDSMEICSFGSTPVPEPEPVDLGGKVRASFGDNVNVDRRGRFAGDEAIGPVEELARAIMMSAESFLKIEELKMEVAARVERMRMETELRRNEMVLDLQVKVMDLIANSLASSCNAGKKRKGKGVDVGEGDCIMNCPPDFVGIGKAE